MATYDLSHPLADGTPVYPGDPPVEVEPAATVGDDGYRVTSLSLGTHAGTHVDAPAHLLADGPGLESYPLETFRFGARRIDLRPLAAREPIDAGRLRDVTPSTVTAADLLVVQTGWDETWGTDRYLEHPYLTADAAEVLLEWDVHVGIDTPNVDPTPTANAEADEPDGFPVHRALFADDRLLLENLRGLAAVPDTFELHAYPLALAAGDAAPVRAVAVRE
ncbi:cyclase family protein [Natrialbaceae archaeon AArc-T1-2]|uniref:cyclase family protein n=1 Tax=Natrialbaceae archaeon AArc-T1-2 TaxID=3053904 RepID=UPI00255B18B6|nr:cyclase family protein [Natrialbaceae archaeon AArc-T1-2]WIV66855.1 cyclase family protein [Natrialbaceae archaeon AArc-T1-2]